MNLIEKINNAFEIFKKKFIIIAIICLLSSFISVDCIPSYIKETFSPEIINSQLDLYFPEGVDLSQVTAALTWMFQISTISSFLLVIAYIFKYSFDKRIFNMKKWQDWKFFLYVSVVPMILLDLLKKLEVSSGLALFDNLIINFFLTLICSLIIIITSSIVLDKEKEPIRIDVEEIERELTGKGDI
jgi:ABC-type multidrug transport system permease subunit